MEEVDADRVDFPEIHLCVLLQALKPVDLSSQRLREERLARELAITVAEEERPADLRAFGRGPLNR